MLRRCAGIARREMMTIVFPVMLFSPVVFDASEDVRLRGGDDLDFVVEVRVVVGNQCQECKRNFV